MDDEELRKLFGTRVKHFRQKLGLSQTQLAENINELKHRRYGLERDSGTSKQVITNIEAGKKFVSAKTLSLVAEALKVAPSDLLMQTRIDNDASRDQLIHLARTATVEEVEVLIELSSAIRRHFTA